MGVVTGINGEVGLRQKCRANQSCKLKFYVMGFVYMHRVADTEEGNYSCVMN